MSTAEDDMFQRHFVDLLIETGDIHPGFLTEKLGLEPSKVMERGKQIPGLKAGVVYGVNLWEISSPLPRTEPLGPHLDCMVEILKEREIQVKEVSAEYLVALVVVVYTDDSTVFCEFEPRILTALGELGVKLDVQVEV